MGELTRVVLRAQDFPAIVERRRRNYARLLDRLGDFAPSVLGDLPRGACPLYYPIQTRNKRAVMARLTARGVATSELWSLPHPSVPAGAFPEVDELRQTALGLPCHQDLSPSAVDRLAEVVRATVEPLR